MTSSADVLDEARASTGLDDFGADTFRDGLERLVRALDDEADLNAVGEFVLHSRVVGVLSQRLQVEDWYRRHPEIDDELIDAPLIGLGLPRTGSTALSWLLTADPNARSPRMWETAQPCPPPGSVEGVDPRVEAAEATAQMQDQAMPRLRLLVPVTPTGPAECQDLMALDFKSHVFQAFAQIPSYSQWLLYDADLTSTYAYERRVLKLLQWRCPRVPWRLKAPTHLIYLEYLDRAFPDARFVMTHRDAADVIVSVADLYAEVIQMFTDHVDLRYLGELNVEQWSVGMRRALAFRDRDPATAARFYDIDFRAMQADPVAEVRGLYAWLGEPVTPEFEAGMRAWWQANAEDRQRAEPREPGYFSLDLEQVRPRFAAYTERFGRPENE